MIRRTYKRSLAYIRLSAAIAASLLLVLSLNGCARLTQHETRPELAIHKETGKASYYSAKFHHRITASGEPLNNYALTAAHKTLPIGSKVVVRNLDNGKSVTVRVTDRGPFVKGRIIDLTQVAFSRIASLDKGVAKVEISVVD